MNSGIKENLFETEDLSSIEIKKEKYIEKTENSSFDFIEKREQIMKKFQNNFIHIYEGNPIETEYIPANFSPKTKNKTTEESLKQNKLKISLEHLISEENKENREKLKKKEKFKKIMNEIEKKNRKKFEIMQSKNKKTIQRDCFSSKIIEKNEKVIYFNYPKIFYHILSRN